MENKCKNCAKFLTCQGRCSGQVEWHKTKNYGEVKKK